METINEQPTGMPSDGLADMLATAMIMEEEIYFQECFEENITSELLVMAEKALPDRLLSFDESNDNGLSVLRQVERTIQPPKMWEKESSRR